MLVVTTSVRVVNGVLSSRKSIRPDQHTRLESCKHGTQSLTMATPRVLGQLFLLPLALKNARPAFNKGLSTRPPPATIPTVARANDEMVFLEPEGNLIRVFLSSTECPMTVA